MDEDMDEEEDDEEASLGESEDREEDDEVRDTAEQVDGSVCGFIICVDISSVLSATASFSLGVAKFVSVGKVSLAAMVSGMLLSSAAELAFNVVSSRPGLFVCSCDLNFSSRDRFVLMVRSVSRQTVGGKGLGMGFSTGLVSPSFISCTIFFLSLKKKKRLKLDVCFFFDET